jgi:6-phosphogluconolactonase
MKIIAYVGTYAGGIYSFRYDEQTGGLEAAHPPAEAENPSWLVLSRNGRFLYSAIETETYEGAPGGGVCAFAVEGRTGALTRLNARPTFGAAPCHLCLDASGRFLLAANYGSGSLSVFPLNADGTIGPMSQLVRHGGSGPVVGRQEGPHAHFAAPAPGSGLLCACDLGADSVFVYRLDEAAGQLLPQEALTVRLRPGSGPRHMAFGPSGRFAYALTELSCRVHAYAYSPSPFQLTELQEVSALPEGFAGYNLCAAIHISPDGNTLYASNRGHDSIAAFRIDRATGMLELLQRAPTLGAWPREFAIDPAGRFLLAANERSDSIVTFAIDGATGRLTPNGRVVCVPKPVCIQFVELAAPHTCGCRV